MKKDILKTYSDLDSAFKKKNSIDDVYTDLIKEHVDADSVILDLGCGSGRLTRSVNSFVKKIVGIDFSATLIKSAKKHADAKNVSYRVMDGEKLVFPKNTFDAVVSHAVLNKKMCRADRALKSAYFVLKSKGKIIIKMIYSTWGKEFKFSGGYNSKELKEILKTIGFKNIKIKIQRQNFESKDYKAVQWVRSTEAVNLSPKKEFEHFFSKSKENYCFDDSFMIVCAEK